MPTKPTLEVTRGVDGGMCLNRDDTAQLGLYIIELEQAAQDCQAQ